MKRLTRLDLEQLKVNAKYEEKVTISRDDFEALVHGYSWENLNKAEKDLRTCVWQRPYGDQ